MAQTEELHLKNHCYIYTLTTKDMAAIMIHSLFINSDFRPIKGIVLVLKETIFQLTFHFIHGNQ